MGIKSLKKHVDELASKNFTELFNPSQKYTARLVLDRLSGSKKSILLLVALNVSLLTSAFIFGQNINLKILQFISLDVQSAQIIIDQRISNLVTLFGATLTVSSLLMTYVSFKEKVAFRLLFRSTLLYPIFFYIISLLSILMLYSILRHSLGIDIVSIVITGTYLILLAIILIGTLFIKLSKVIGPEYFFQTLKSEIIKEVSKKTRIIIFDNIWHSQYENLFKKLGFSPNIQFSISSPDYIGLAPLPAKKNADHNNDESPMESFLEPKHLYIIKDINFLAIQEQFKDLNEPKYFNMTSRDRTINRGDPIIEIPSDFKLGRRGLEKFSRAFKVRKYQVVKNKIDSEFITYLDEKFKKETLAGNLEYIHAMLEIYEQIYIFEDQIVKSTSI